MYDNYIELKVEGLTRGRELKDAYILILREREGERIFPVLIDEEGFNMIMQAMRNKDYTCSHLMVKLASRVGMTPIGIRLMQPANGKTQALIDFELVNEIVSITTPIAEAVVTALETRSSLWVQRTTFERQTRMNKNGGSQNMALPITAMSDKLISDALQAAVKEDNFELATILRDELNKRKDKESEIGAEE
jgi:bifunctional DNase/RNase|uniref:UvrB/UvrC motif-containing protein n=1 Tax=Alloprevotella sp. TaxID=1872471 RepID=UPI0015B3E1CA